MGKKEKISDEEKLVVLEDWKQENGLYKCPYCGKEYVKKGISTHIWRKHTNEGKLFTINHDPNKGYKDGTRKPFIKKGQTFKEIYGDRADEIIEKMSLKKKNAYNKLSDEDKEKFSKWCSDNAKKTGFGGYNRNCGRGKKGRYKGYWCDSSWELAYVIYNLEHNIPFERNTEGFEYEFDGKKRKYYPDFILEDGSFIEIKGYENELSKAKHKQFKKKLQVLYYEDLNKVFDYVIDKYGKDFIRLYSIESDLVG